VENQKEKEHKDDQEVGGVDSNKTALREKGWGDMD
jgi:hypothetical protein